MLKVGQAVTLILADGTHVKGKIAVISNEAVTVHETKGGAERTIPRDMIVAVKRPLPVAVKILIGAGAVYGGLAIIWLLSAGGDCALGCGPG